jgi:hypothetical protein
MLDLATHNLATLSATLNPATVMLRPLCPLLATLNPATHSATHNLATQSPHEMTWPEAAVQVALILVFGLIGYALIRWAAED